MTFEEALHHAMDDFMNTNPDGKRDLKFTHEGFEYTYRLELDQAIRICYGVKFLSANPV